MIHGGGHIMLSRKDVRPEQTCILLNNGFIPVSVDYRLCPEMTLTEGPMVDVTDALVWIRNVLPSIPLQRQDVRIDGERVVSVGWSTGGYLAMCLAWTSVSHGIRPPNAILAFYCPTDYEDPFWTTPNIPTGSEITAAKHSYYTFDEDIWAGVSDHQITGYNIPPNKQALGGWLESSDPRSRIALYMNWHGRSLHVLLNGLDTANREEPPTPTSSQIAAISPLTHIRNGNYTTPTFIVHPRQDDLIPWEQAQRTYEALQMAGVVAKLRIVEDAKHLFDLDRRYRSNESARKAVNEGYEFLRRHVDILP